MRKRLRHVSGADFLGFMKFSADHSAMVKRDDMLLKLTIFNFVAPIVERYKPKTILEVGCGLGIHSALLTNFGRVSATDLETPGSFAVADAGVPCSRELILKELAKSDVGFTIYDGCDLPFPSQSFDLAFHNSVIEHVADPTVFNRETARVLKPGGIVICITGTPALCWFRFLRDYLLRLPVTMLGAVVKELSVTKRPKISDQIEPLVPKDVPAPAFAAPVSRWNARLFHYAYSPIYNAVVLDELAESAGLTKDEALVAAYRYMSGSRLHRFRYYLTPRTHGQHYRNFLHEKEEWKLDHWREKFTSAGFEVVEIIPYRFHHVFELTWSSRINSALYHCAAPIIERIGRLISPSFASEFILVARKL